MYKVLLILVIVASVGFGLIFFFARTKIGGQVSPQLQSTAQVILPSPKEVPLTAPEDTSLNKPITKKEFLEILQASMAAEEQRINAAVSSKQQATLIVPNSNTQSKTSTTTNYTGPKTLYIPLGNSGTGTNGTVDSYEDVAAQEVTIDTNNYSGYKQMVFEVQLGVYQGNGLAYARLLNKTDGTAILSSEVSSTSDSYVLKSSSGFTLPTGAKTYVVQVKSTTGYPAQLQLARIRVDF